MINLLSLRLGTRQHLPAQPPSPSVQVELLDELREAENLAQSR